MKSGGGKQKGNSFENKIARMLSEWISEGKNKDLFCRSPASGAKATINLKLGEMFSDQAGDIIATGEKGFKLTSIFFIEAKHYQKLNIEGFVYDSKAGITEFWIKACKEAKEHNKLPMLIARQNNRPILLGLNTPGDLLLKNLLPLKLYVPKLDLYIFSFDEFLSKVHHSILGIQPKTDRYKLVQ
jgi:hypothetical protein